VKILIVDDSPLDRKLLIRTLQKSGVDNEIIEATDGEAALEVLESDCAEMCLMFLDWQLPKIDGLEILKQIARNPKTKNLSVIMLTSTVSPDNEDLAQMLNPKLVALMTKPIDPERIMEVALPYIK